jgi:serine/threonine protein kinase
MSLSAGTRLGRDVAIKTSKESFDERFHREARTIAALNHPNVCTLRDVGPDYLVMEYVERATLSDRIREGVLPEPDALAIAMQIATALEVGEPSVIAQSVFRQTGSDHHADLSPPLHHSAGTHPLYL